MREQLPERWSTDAGIVDARGEPIPPPEPPPPMTDEQQAALDRQVAEQLAAAGVNL